MTTTAPHATTAEQAQSGGMPAGQIRDSKHSASGRDRRRPPGDRPGDRPAPALAGAPVLASAAPSLPVMLGGDADSGTVPALSVPL